MIEFAGTILIFFTVLFFIIHLLITTMYSVVLDKFLYNATRLVPNEAISLNLRPNINATSVCSISPNQPVSCDGSQGNSAIGRLTTLIYDSLNETIRRQLNIALQLKVTRLNKQVRTAHLFLLTITLTGHPPSLFHKAPALSDTNYVILQIAPSFM